MKFRFHPKNGFADLTRRQLSILPSQIFYNRLAISETPIGIARREIIDIRTQLMAEDSADHDNAELIAGLEEGDLKPNFYEGGFKTWECALDLAKLVASESAVVESLGDSQTNVHIIEVGTSLTIDPGESITEQSTLNSSEQALQSHHWLYLPVSSAKQSPRGMPRNAKRISHLRTTMTRCCVSLRFPISF
jgi:hypothetical protein